MIYLMISILVFFIGMILFILGYLGRYELSKSGLLDDSNAAYVGKEKEEINQKIEDADKILSELNKFSTYISKEMEDKHKELLFLYQLIDEKQQNLKSEDEKVSKTIEKNSKLGDKKAKAASDKKVKQVEKDNKETEEKEPESDELEGNSKVKESKEVNETDTVKVKNILKSNKTTQQKVRALHSLGKSIDEIAQILKKGKSEIRLMIDMGNKG